MLETKRGTRLSAWDFIDALAVAIRCLITYWMITLALRVWSTRRTSFSVGCGPLSRPHCVRGNAVSFALCLAYLCIFRSTPEGMALLAIGILVMARMGRRDNIVTTGVATIVGHGAAALNPHDPLNSRCSD